MSARVLIVEDNSANLELMSYLLTSAGHEVAAAGDGREGMELAQRFPPDLIVCDVQMPEMNGYEFARLLKSEPALRHIPLVAVTAFAMARDRDDAFAAGFDAYLAKPIDPETFVRQLEVFLPVGKHAAARTEPTSAAEAPVTAQGSGRVILVLDNMQPNLDFACSLFSYAGYRAVAAKSVDQAMALARREPPDLILSDMCMPQSSGYDFIKMVKAEPRLAAIPFVFLTSTALTSVERTEALSLGAAKYLIRPIEPEKLLAEVAACFEQDPAA